MEFKIKRKDFLEGLSFTQGVVEKKNTMPILSHILLDAEREKVKISATDLEVAICCQVGAQVVEEGKMTVLARSIQEIVRESENEDIQCSTKEGDRLVLQSGSAIFKIAGLNASEFPLFPSVETKPVIVPCEFFSQLIDKTSFAMAVDETRYNLNGVLMSKKGGGGVGTVSLMMVATDGHRLAMVERREEISLGGEGDFNVIIPRKGVGELAKLLSGGGSFQLSVGKKGMIAERDSQVLYIRYLDGEFPDYEAVIPKENNIIASIPKAKLGGALRRVSLLSNERSRGVILSFSSGNLEVSATHPDLGEAREEFPIDYRGQKMNIGFNARYLLDILDILPDEKVVIAMQGEVSACLVKSEYDPGFLAVIMPMRI